MKNKNRNFSQKKYFNLQAAKLQPTHRFYGSSEADFKKWKENLLGEIKNILGPMPHPVPLNSEIIWEVESEDVIKRKIVFDSEEDMSVLALIYIPKDSHQKRFPAILCNHGHGKFGKDSVMGVRSNNVVERNCEIKSMNFDYGLQMAKQGYVTMAIDWRGFGERADSPDAYSGRDKCNVHFIKASLMGINLLTLNIFDGMRAIDYLCEQPFVDKNRIGAMGLSLGGTMTTWLALLDERIKAADIICYSCCFKEFAVKNANFCGSQILPRLFEICDVPDLQGLIAPKPLLVEIGIHDKCFKIEEALNCRDKVSNIYKAADVVANFHVDIFEGDHRFAGNKAFEFFDKNL